MVVGERGPLARRIAARSQPRPAARGTPSRADRRPELPAVRIQREGRLDGEARFSRAGARLQGYRAQQIKFHFDFRAGFLLEVMTQPVSLTSKMIPLGSLNFRSKPSSPSSPRSKKNSPPAASIAACWALRSSAWKPK